jgi:hypothetical protein
MSPMNKIQFDDWLFPKFIYLSNDGNIYTTAHELDHRNTWSNNKYLFQINKENNKIMNKIELNDIDFYDLQGALFLNNKIILCFKNRNNVFDIKENEMTIIEFY